MLCKWVFVMHIINMHHLALRSILEIGAPSEYSLINGNVNIADAYYKRYCHQALLTL